MRAYIGGNDQSQAYTLACLLKNGGTEVISGWINDPEFKQPKSATVRARKAVQCINEITVADICIFFDPQEPIPGGVHVEVGYALGAGKPTFVIFKEGTRSNTIMYHPRIWCAFNMESVAKQLTGWDYTAPVISLSPRSTRKIIQISKDDGTFDALCDDGSVWWMSETGWKRHEDIPE